jgi:prepilin-type N-terminal cleavage/methylation domain-containing protein
MRISKLQFISKQHQSSAGFTIVELLVSIAIMGITSSLISYAVGSMISSNQTIGREQNRRLEVSRALDLIVRDIKISQILPISDVKNTLTVVGTPVLHLELVPPICTGADAYKNTIVYSIEPSSSDKTAIGPNVIYRSGLITNIHGKLDCSESSDPVPVADAIDLGTMEEPICGPSQDSQFYPTGSRGFYTCVYGTQVTVAILTKFSGNKMYGISQTTNSNSPVSIPSVEPNTCEVPQLIQSDTGQPALSPDAAQKAIENNRLRYYRINTQLGGTSVITQTPLAGSKIPCDTGLVIYTY